MQWLWAAAVVLCLLAFAGMSAEAALRAIAGHPARSVASRDPVAADYEADDHFPGAALLYAEVTPVASPTGTTGTIDLPALPVPVAVAEAAVRADTGIVPALPFSSGKASAIDRGRALECLSAAIYYEAGSEPLQGQEAVAQVVLNRVRHPAFPPTVCGIVYQGSDRAGCQFSFACNGAMLRAPSAAGWARATRVAAAALAGFVYAPVGLATHYHTYAVTPAWNRTLVMTDMVGAHLFHRWKGYWGTAAAFRQIYRGGEPVPGPRIPEMPSEPLKIAAAVPVTAAPVQAIRPAYADSGTPVRQPVATDDHLPDAAVVLDRWKDSGTFRSPAK